MQIGIVGLPTSGKTTLFNALTGAHAETSVSGYGRRDPNRGVVHVPDARLDALRDMYSPKKVTQASIDLTDVAGLSKGSSQDAGFTGEFLGHLREMEALLVVREKTYGLPGSINRSLLWALPMRKMPGIPLPVPALPWNWSPLGSVSTPPLWAVAMIT